VITLYCKSIMGIFSYLKKILARYNRAKVFLVLFTIFLILVIKQLFEINFLLWVILSALTTYFVDTEYKKKNYLQYGIMQRKAFILLILIVSILSLRDVNWNRFEWLKTYLDSGTVLFLLFIVFSYLFSIKRYILVSISLFGLMLIPIFILMEFPILADAYAVFSFLLISYLIIKEVSTIRNII